MLLYGQNLAMNHLIATKTINVIKLENLIDYPSANDESVFEKVHIHVFHGENLFSKFMFRDGRYNNMTAEKLDKTRVKNYALDIALQSKILSPLDQSKLLKIVISNKE